MVTLTPMPLTTRAFALYGDVIQTLNGRHYSINEGTTERYHDLANLDLTAADGRPLISIFRAQPRTLPMAIRMLERHPLSSQAFMPLDRCPFLVVVATGTSPDPASVRAFSSDGRQGVNYRRGVWHHPLLVLERVGDFVVLDRGAEDDNCDYHHFPDQVRIIVDLPHEDS